MVMPAASRFAFILSTAAFVGSSTASRRRMTVMGRMTSRYLPPYAEILRYFRLIGWSG